MSRSTPFPRTSIEIMTKYPRQILFLLVSIPFCLYLLTYHPQHGNNDNDNWTKVENRRRRMLPVSVSLSKASVEKSLILNSSNTPTNDPLLLDIIRKEFIIPPSSLPYNFGDPELNKKDENKNPSYGAVQAIQHILKDFTDDPFYVECGANDGEWGSNSLYLEKMGWQGLLIEADSTPFEQLQMKHRKAYSGHFCLSDTQHPKIVTFYQDVRPGALGSSLIKNNLTYASAPITVQCFPLVSILLAMERPLVDFFSLDVEGSELDILQTVDFNAVTIKVITIENVHLRQGKEALRVFMESKGFFHFKDVSQDSIFVHPSVWNKL